MRSARAETYAAAPSAGMPRGASTFGGVAALGTRRIDEPVDGWSACEISMHRKVKNRRGDRGLGSAG